MAIIRTYYKSCILSHRYASCCWISLRQGGGSWEIRVRMNLAPRSDNGLINSSPITNMPPIVRIQRQCNNRIAVPGEVVSGTHFVYNYSVTRDLP